MFRIRKKNRTVNETQLESPPPAAVGVDQETKTPPLLTDAFKTSIEKAADRSRNELVSEGKLKPMAFFANADGTMKTVSFSVKDE
jgi:hypothetical protein